MTDIAVLIQGENGADSMADINANFASLNAADQPVFPEQAVDGNRTVFTFPSLTDQPRFVGSDNTLMRAETSRGTINWTWNQSTKQVTMLATPQDDMFALA